MKKSFLLKIDQRRFNVIEEYAYCYSFKSITEFITFCIDFTIYCIICPENANDQIQAALRFHKRRIYDKYKNKNIAN